MTRRKREFLFIVFGGVFTILWLFLCFALSSWAGKMWPVRDATGASFPVAGIITFVVTFIVGIFIVVGVYDVCVEEGTKK